MDAMIMKNNESFTLESHGFDVKDFIVSSIPIVPHYDNVDGRDGMIDYGAVLGQRTIIIPFYFRSKSLHDFSITRDKLFSLVIDKTPFYIKEMRRKKQLAYKFIGTTEIPAMDPETANMLVNGKQYLVRLQNTFEIEQMLELGEGELVFETTNLPYAESTLTTMDIDRDGVPLDWGAGMGVDPGDASLKYFIQDGEPDEPVQFQIYNAGNVGVHPFYQKLKITLTPTLIPHYGGCTIENITNGTFFRYTEELNKDDELVIDGPKITVNDLQAFRKTNRQYIQLSPGWNVIEVNAAWVFTIEFDFRYYYY